MKQSVGSMELLEMSAGVEYLIIYEDICLRSIILSVRGVVGEKLILLPN